MRAGGGHCNRSLTSGERNYEAKLGMHPAPPSGDGKCGVLGLLKRAGPSRQKNLYPTALHRSVTRVTMQGKSFRQAAFLVGGLESVASLIFLLSALSQGLDLILSRCMRAW